MKRKGVSINNLRLRIKAKNYLRESINKRKAFNWDDTLTPSFLASTTQEIIDYNNTHRIPIIYAEKGIIYKKTKSHKIELGKITRLKRAIVENNYTIE